MSEQIGRWRATYTPGEWIVVGGPTSLVIVRPTSSRSSDMVTGFWEVVVRAESLEGLVRELAQYDVERMPDFAAFFWHSDEMRSLVRGGVQVNDQESGATIATGEGVQTWTESGLGGVRRVRVVMEPDADPEDGLRLPLVVGAVRAATIDLDADAVVSSPQGLRATGRADRAEENPPAEASRPADEAPPAIAPEPAEEPALNPFGPPPASLFGPQPGPPPQANQPYPRTEAFTPPFAQQPPAAPMPQGFQQGPPPGVPQQQPGFGLGGPQGPGSWQPAGERQGDPSREMVLAVICEHGHPNPPEAQRCRRCGGQLQGQPRMVPRPVTAMLRPSTGAPVQVDRSVLIGRSPQANRVARDQLPKLLTVPSPSHDISRTHVQVSPEGWDLVATDLHSTNGTLLIRPGHPEAERMAPGEPLSVYPGCVLDLGDGVTILVDHPA